MPYAIKYQPSKAPKGRPWKIWNTEKNKQVGSSVTKEDAEASVRARYGGHGSGGKKRGR